MAHAIDTLRITQKLESAGVDRRHAEAHAEALNEVVVTEFSELATKADLERLPTREDLNHFATKADLERLPTREDLNHFATKADLERLPTREDLKHFATKADLERLPTREDLKHFATKEDLKQYPTRSELEAALASLENRMFRLWAASTVTLATLIISMPFVAG